MAYLFVRKWLMGDVARKFWKLLYDSLKRKALSDNLSVVDRYVNFLLLLFAERKCKWQFYNVNRNFDTHFLHICEKAAPFQKVVILQFYSCGKLSAPFWWAFNWYQSVTLNDLEQRNGRVLYVIQGHSRSLIWYQCDFPLVNNNLVLCRTVFQLPRSIVWGLVPKSPQTSPWIYFCSGQRATLSARRPAFMPFIKFVAWQQRWRVQQLQRVDAIDRWSTWWQQLFSSRRPPRGTSASVFW